MPGGMTQELDGQWGTTAQYPEYGAGQYGAAGGMAQYNGAGQPGLREHYGLESKPMQPRELEGTWQPTELDGQNVEMHHALQGGAREGSPGYEPQPNERLIGGNR